MPFDSVEEDERFGPSVWHDPGRQRRGWPDRQLLRTGGDGHDGDPPRQALPEAIRGMTILYALIPGLLIVVLSFRTGGADPATTALGAVVLAGVLGARVAAVRRPFAGAGPAYLATAGALALFALWTLASIAWSHAPGRAVIEFDRTMLYALAFIVLGAWGRTPQRLRWMVRGIAAGAVIVCICALATRLLPDVWQLPGAAASARLSYPVGYWNGLGLLAALGFLVSFALTSDEQEHRVGRVMAAAALPILAVTIFLTFSRGAIAAGAVGLVVLVVVGRPRALLSGLVVAVPTVAMAVAAAYRADLLATDNPTTAAAAAQGHDVALMVGFSSLLAVLARTALLNLNPPSVRWRVGERLRRGRTPMAAAIVVVAAGVFISGFPSAVGRQYERFVQGDPEGATATNDNRLRLASPRNNGRLLYWQVALEGVSREPVRGQGAGTYALQWDRLGRKTQFDNAHSLYLETLTELGVVGLLLLVAALVLVLAGFLARARGPDRVLGGALFAAGIAWALHAAIDWDWELPAITWWLFAAGGLALAAPLTTPREPSPPMALDARIVVLLWCVAFAIIPGRAYLSSGPLHDSASALQRGDCARATALARHAQSALGARSEPFLIVGYCNVRLGRPDRAMRAMRAAVHRDPRNWAVHYGMSVAQAAAGVDPRPEARLASRLKPREPLPGQLLRLFDSMDPRTWQRRARTADPPPADP